MTRLEIAVQLLAQRADLSPDDAAITLALESADRILHVARYTAPRTRTSGFPVGPSHVVAWEWGGAE